MKIFKKTEDIIFNIVFFPGTPDEVIKNKSEEFKKIIIDKNFNLKGLSFKEGTKVLDNGNTMFYVIYVCPEDGFYFV